MEEKTQETGKSDYDRFREQKVVIEWAFAVLESNGVYGLGPGELSVRS